MYVQTSYLSKATEFLLNLHSVKIRQIVLILSTIILLKDQIVSKNMLLPTETLLIWLLAYYYVNLPTPGLDRERCSTLDSQSLMFTKCLQNICTLLFLSLSYAKLATYGDTLAPFAELFFWVS